MSPVCYQVNLHNFRRGGWGGAEIYTGSFAHALASHRIATVLFVQAPADFWIEHLPEGSRIVPVASPSHILEQLPPHERCWLATHTPMPASVLTDFRQTGHFVTSFAHQPVHGTASWPCDMAIPVSGYVLDTLRRAGMSNTYGSPLYGVADFSGSRNNGQIRSGPLFDWDRRKMRDRLLSWMAPAWRMLATRQAFERGPGIALGIVSRLTPIKQFPLLFRHLVPVLSRHPAFHIDVFGSGGYAYVRDLKNAVAPLGNRVRFWGQQDNVAAVYRELDYLIVGLPEKEALGLNVLESQACGTPVLAVNAPPFTETIAENLTGIFYQDPRNDGGRSFDALLTRLEQQPFILDEEALACHLTRFSHKAFDERVGRLIESIMPKLSSNQAKPRQPLQEGL